MAVFQVMVAAGATLLAVVLGGWLTLRGQERSWKRDHARQWRDIRLEHYVEFISAFREYVAFVQLPTTQIRAVPRQRVPHDLMPYFDEAGSKYRERLDTAKTALRLVCGTTDLVEASRRMVHEARSLAAARASRAAENIPAGQFDQLWKSERAFVELARNELGLHIGFDVQIRHRGPKRRLVSSGDDGPSPR